MSGTGERALGKVIWGDMMAAWTRAVAMEMEKKIDLQYGQEQNSQNLATDWLREREESNILAE